MYNVILVIYVLSEVFCIGGGVMPIRNLIFPNEKQKIKEFISDLIMKVKIVLQTKQTVVIALSGGRSPINMLRELSNETSLDWSKIIVTLVDDRIIDTNNIDSNQRLLMDNLFINKAVGTRFIGLVDLSVSENDMVLNAEKIPPIDIAVLGMGEDGHTASIFPDCDELNTALDEHYTYNYIITRPKINHLNRIGLSLKAIKQIPYKYIITQGAKKAEVLQKAIKGHDISLPISYLFDDKTQDIFILQNLD